MQDQITRKYQFGPFHLDATERLLLKDGQPIALMPKAFDTLLLLVENRGRLLNKEELMRSIWPDAVVEGNSLNRSVSVLRKTLGESHGQAKYIETVPKHGYRFLAPVVEIETGDGDLIIERHSSAEVITEEEEVTDSSGANSANPALAARRVTRLNHWVVQASALVTVTLLAAVGYLLISGRFDRAASGVRVKSIAVLPFRDIGASNDDNHLGLGMADVIITRLSNLREVNVRPTSAVMKFDQQDLDWMAVAQMLQVDAVLDGSIHRNGDKLRVTARLVRASDQSPIWAGQFDETTRDLFSVQDEISAQVVDSLKLNLTGHERATLRKRYTENADAYQLYVKGRYYWNKRSITGMVEAQFQFRQAIEKDPNFALAYVGLADTLLMQTQEASLAVNKAIELDSSLGEAYATLGFASMFYGWDWGKSEESFKHAIELNPGYGTAHQWYATLLAMTGRASEAKQEMKRALEIDPLSFNFLADLGQMHYFAREYDEAERYCRQALQANPDFHFAHEYLSDIYTKTGRETEAFEERLIASRAFTRDPKYGKDGESGQAGLREIYRKSGMKGVLRNQIEDGVRETVPGFSYVVAKSYALLGEKEQALAWLEKSCLNKDFLIAFVKAEPIFDDLRSEPRYQAVLRRMGLA